MGSHSLLQGIFPIQGLNPGLPTLQLDSLPSEPPGKPCSVTKLCPTLCDPMDPMEAAYKASLSFTISWSLLKLVH